MPADPDAIARAFVALLRERARSLGLNQYEIARRVGVDQSHISRVFSYRRGVSLEIALALCDALETNLEAVVGEARASVREESAAG